jgi:hypothetical protein
VSLVEVDKHWLDVVDVSGEGSGEALGLFMLSVAAAKNTYGT